jgi:CTP:molybdopterin cytidylyltransferase MocA
MLTGIILSAGASRRMGRPKALLNYRGETFLNRLIRVAGQVADPIIVVVGPPYAEQIREHAIAGSSFPEARGTTEPGAAAQIVVPDSSRAAPALCRFVTNPAPERGQLSSLQIALAELPQDGEGFFFIPVDCPAVREETVRRVAATFARRDPQTLFVIPRHGDRRGHPVFAARSIASELLALPAEAQARDVVHRYVSQTLYVDVDDSGILADIDDPAAYRELMDAAR